jgi:hypothetical protein
MIELENGGPSGIYTLNEPDVQNKRRIEPFHARSCLLDQTPSFISFHDQRIGEEDRRTLSFFNIMLDLSSSEYTGYHQKMSNTSILDMLELPSQQTNEV